jgi:hypothetical protein
VSSSLGQESLGQEGHAASTIQLMALVGIDEGHLIIGSGHASLLGWDYALLVSGRCLAADMSFLGAGSMMCV